MNVSLLCATSCHLELLHRAWHSLEHCLRAARAWLAAEFGLWWSVPDTPKCLLKTNTRAATLIYTIPGHDLFYITTSFLQL